MPEYLAPGVFVEEVSFRSKPIEGVPTTTTGFAGMTRYGPVFYTGGPSKCGPRLITSFTEFERVYGGLDDIAGRRAYLAHAVRAFFENGGQRLYVSRVFAPTGGGAASADVASATTAIMDNANGVARWRARWPGRSGNVLVTTTLSRSGNIAVNTGGNVTVRGVRNGAVVVITSPAPSVLPGSSVPLVTANLRVVVIDADGNQSFINSANANVAPAVGDLVQQVQVSVRIDLEDGRALEFAELATHTDQRRNITAVFDQDDPEDEDAPVYLSWAPANAEVFQAARLMEALAASGAMRLSGGRDGVVIDAAGLRGQAADPDNEASRATGLEALAEIEDISIVAAPDAGTLANAGQIEAAAGYLIAHAESLRYRIAVIDPPQSSSLSEVRAFRGKFDSTRAAIYYPWVQVLDPSVAPGSGAAARYIDLPPSGYVTGIYARNDITRGVHKAPANEVVRGITGFSANVTKPRQEVLNPEGINALRFFEGRGNRLWGARTMTSDGEWKYVNVRRLFNFIERSIDLGTQYAVFEPNGPRLWGQLRRSIEDFLLVLWKQGALLGAKPEQAFFVRCDRTTMTQNDLDNGRLVCLIGISPIKPAEFVIFRIGQITADAGN